MISLHTEIRQKYGLAHCYVKKNINSAAIRCLLGGKQYQITNNLFLNFQHFDVT